MLKEKHIQAPLLGTFRRWMENAYFQKVARVVLILSSEVPVFDVCPSLNSVHPVLLSLCAVSSMAGTKHFIMEHEKCLG
jgi:hypothetical protein